MQSVVALTLRLSRSSRSSHPRGVRGVAAVELAVLLTPLVLMIFGATELGRAVYTYNILDKAVRDAARYLSQNGTGDSTVYTQAKCLAVGGSLVTSGGSTTCQGAALATGLTTSMVTICDASLCASTNQNQSTGSGAINLVSVTITGYAFTSLATFVIPNMTFRPVSVTMRGQL